MSANNAVTVLRSPSVAAEASICSAVTRIPGVFGLAAVAPEMFVEAALVRAAPQSAQKRAPSAVSEPHFGQRRLSVAPQRMQNLLPAAVSKSQLEQRIGVQRMKMTNSPLVPLPHLKGHRGPNPKGLTCQRYWKDLWRLGI